MRKTAKKKTSKTKEQPRWCRMYNNEPLQIRKFQDDAVLAIIDWMFGLTPIYAGFLREALIAQATGLGKTVTACRGILEIRKRSPQTKILWLTHRRDLVNQSAAALKRIMGSEINIGIERGGTKSNANDDIVVACVPALNQKRLQTLAKRFQPNLIVCDEAHHALAKSWMHVKQIFSTARILNLTATPFRKDISRRLDLGIVLSEVSTEQGIACKAIVPPKTIESIKINLDESNGHDGKDYKITCLTKLLMQEDALNQCVESITRHAFGRKTMIFAANVAHGNALTAKLRALKRPDGTPWRVGEVYGYHNDTQKDAVYDAISDGNLDIIVNNMVCTEGFDQRCIDLLAILRPTLNAALYVQMLGRGLRACIGKTECWVIDVFDTAKNPSGKEKPLPTTTELHRAEALANRAISPVELYLSWCYQRSDLTSIAEGTLKPEQCQKLNTPRKLYQNLGLPWKRENPPQDILAKLQTIWQPNGQYSTLCEAFKCNDMEALRLLLRQNGWVYLPHNETPNNSAAAKKIIRREEKESTNYNLTEYLAEDTKLHNFIFNLLRNDFKTQSHLSWDWMDTNGRRACWLKHTSDNQTFHFIHNNNRQQKQSYIWLRNPQGQIRKFIRTWNGGMGEDPNYNKNGADLPSFCFQPEWDNKPMTEQQAYMVAKATNNDIRQVRQLNLSRMAASNIISHHIAKRDLAIAIELAN